MTGRREERKKSEEEGWRMDNSEVRRSYIYFLKQNEDTQGQKYDPHLHAHATHLSSQLPDVISSPKTLTWIPENGPRC